MAVLTRVNRRAALVAAGFSAMAVLAAPAPAQATEFYWHGPLQTYEICEAIALDYSQNGAAVTGCQYRDLYGTNYDGWYFRHTGLP